MLSPTPPTLSDRTKVADLVNVATREVQMRALSDPELYEMEMEQIPVLRRMRGERFARRREGGAMGPEVLHRAPDAIVIVFV